MKLEIIKEEKFNEGVWYALNVNNIPHKYSRKLEEVEQLYEELKANPELLNTKVTILKTEEI
jgi:hypothetical protein